MKKYSRGIFGKEMGFGRRSVRGFSMVEILVAVGVMALLAALVVPGASRYFEKARSSQCVTKLRGLGVVMSQFRAERNQRTWNRRDVADGGEGDIAPVRAFQRAGLIASAQELLCPSATTSSQGAWQVGGTGSQEYLDRFGNQYVSYAVNGVAFYRSTPHMMSTSPVESYLFFAGHESQTPLFMDGTFFQLNDNTWRNETRFDRLALRHQDRCNVVFLDGHVESLDSEAIKRLDPYGGTHPRWMKDFGFN